MEKSLKEQAIKYANHFGSLLDVPCAVVDLSEKSYEPAGEGKPFDACENCPHKNCKGYEQFAYGCREAYRWDGLYTFHCYQEMVVICASIASEKGDLAGSISKMPDITYLEKYLKENGDGIISGAASVVLELDLSETIAEMIVNLAKKHHKKIYSIVGNMSVILARKDLVRQTDCFICNEIEAGKFFDDPALTAFNPAQMLDYLPGAAKEAGIRSMVVTMGAQGSVYYDEDTHVSGICKPIPVQVVDTSGAGDAFFSGTVMALIRAIPLQDAVVYGARLASATISRAENKKVLRFMWNVYWSYSVKAGYRKK